MDGFTLALLVKAEGKLCTLGMYAPVQPSRFWQLYGQGHRRECRIQGLWHVFINVFKKATGITPSMYQKLTLEEANMAKP